MRAIVIGAGATTRAILERIDERWEVAVVDPSSERLDELARVRPITMVVGDGSSRVVLDRAGIDRSDAVVAATGDDEVSLEACRLARAAGVDRVVAIAADGNAITAFRALDIPVVSPDRLAARQVEITLEPRRVNSAAFADGRAEAIEFRITPDSPLRGRSLMDLRLQRWLVAAVLRDGRLLVPNGQTVLKADDLVTVVGAAEDFSAMVRTFTAAESRFPEPFGRDVAVAIDGADDPSPIVREAVALVRASDAASLVIVHRDPARLDPATAAAAGGRLDRVVEACRGVEHRLIAVPDPGLRGMLRLHERESIGVVVVAKPQGRVTTVATLRAIREAGVAALLVAGAFPYQAIVTPARDSIAGWSATWTAIDLAHRSDVPLEAIGVAPPGFLAARDEPAEIRRAVARIRDEASIRGVPVTGRVETGNPVRVLRAIPTDRLLVLNQGRRPANLLAPGITGHIIAGNRASVMVVPDRATG